MEQKRFFKLRRANGELVFFNLDHVSMVFADPVDRSILIVGTGYEKRFRAEEGLALMHLIDAMSTDVRADMPAGQ